MHCIRSWLVRESVAERLTGEIQSATILVETTLEILSDRGSTPLISTILRNMATAGTPWLLFCFCFNCDQTERPFDGAPFQLETCGHGQLTREDAE